MFNGKRVVIVGYGKSALDMATLAAERSAQVHHVFRTPSWLIPEWILGRAFHLRLVHPLRQCDDDQLGTAHGHGTLSAQQTSFVISSFWDLIQSIVLFQLKRNGKGKDQAAQERLKTLIPEHKILMDFRSSGALGPENYYPLVAEGKIFPYHSEIECFSHETVQLKNGHGDSM